MSAARADLLRALGVLCEAPDPGHVAVAEALGLPAPGNDGTFLFQVYPYAPVFLGDEGMLGGEARDRVAGFWRAVGLTPPPEPDHLASLLGLSAALLEDEEEETDPARRTLRRQARTALLWEHVCSWAVPFLRATAAVGGPFHEAWAALAEETLLDEGHALGGPPAELPIALREAPAFPGDDARLDELLTAALAPVRSGIVVTRDDLTRAGRALGVGVRIGERRFILRSMVEQDPAGTFGWLGGEASAWAGTHAGTRDALGAIATFWEGRARAAKDRFLQLAEAAEGVMVGAADR